MTRHWHQHKDDRGNLWLGLDYADGAVNLLSVEVLDELDHALAELKPEPPSALIIHSMKQKGFIAGADVKELVGGTDLSAFRAHIRRVHAILGELEALPCPTLALIHGFCLGGGLELALACRYRIASDDPASRIGFPEVRLGIFPGYGGTWRAIRTLGPVAALQIMLSGRALSAKQAQRLGLADRVVPHRQLHAAGLELLEEAPGPRRPGLVKRLPGAWPLRPLAAAWMRRRTAERVKPENYPAPFALIEHWRNNSNNGVALLRSEAERVADLLAGDTAQNLIRVFLLQERLKGLARGDVPPPLRVHVIGAGVMGGDIAAWAALSGRKVSLQDISVSQLGAAMRRAHALFERRLKDARRVRDAGDRLLPDPRGDALAAADLVIEAVVEDRAVKRELLTGLERRVSAQTLLATNTSSIPLEDLCDGLSKPERLIGLHFFNPVARMQLVEVVQAPDTDQTTVAGGLAFVRSIDRLPLPVRSGPGFLVNRVLMPYLLEAVDLLDEGIPALAVDRAALDFGMPLGPLALADSVGLDICLAVAKRLGSGLAAPEEPPPRLTRLVAEGRLGRKSGHGFYRYHEGRAVPAHLPRRYRPPPDLAERMIFRLLNEAVACLREGVVQDPDLLDAGVVFGTGFAPFRGGPMRMIEQGGWTQMQARLSTLERSHGDHFRADSGWQGLARA